ncbi:MAG: HipA domain-containing protein [Candidatus Symbiothrix sp.]|jgi:serine/threonine-protein kinase HipA|nr:HipA domain-containing protein [Candidatus Symbiothrix sp.]
MIAAPDTYTPITLKRVFDTKKVSPLLAFSNVASQRKVIDENIGKISISGVQEKLSVIIDHEKIILTPEGVQGTHIIKAAPDYKRLKNRNQLPANEHLTMQIAQQVYGLSVAENAMVFFRNGEAAYITKRFDIDKNKCKIKQEDFASLSQKTKETDGDNFKYTGDYVTAGQLIKQFVAAWQIETVKYFRLIVFNYLFANGDAHLKNFSLQQTTTGDYLLTPAYDLLNTSLHVNDEDFALSGGLFDKQHCSEIYLQTSHPCQEDFMTFGTLLEIPKVVINKTLNKFTTPQGLVTELTERSFLNEQLKRMYLRSYQERLSRLQR